MSRYLYLTWRFGYMPGPVSILNTPQLLGIPRDQLPRNNISLLLVCRVASDADQVQPCKEAERQLRENVATHNDDATRRRPSPCPTQRHVRTIAYHLHALPRYAEALAESETKNGSGQVTPEGYVADRTEPPSTWTAFSSHYIVCHEKWASN